jgi:hypothetical protein
MKEKDSPYLGLSPSMGTRLKHFLYAPSNEELNKVLWRESVRDSYGGNDGIHKTTKFPKVLCENLKID